MGLELSPTILFAARASHTDLVQDKERVSAAAHAVGCTKTNSLCKPIPSSELAVTSTFFARWFGVELIPVCAGEGELFNLQKP